MTEIRRIGREANPAERGLQLVIENPDVLESMAEQLYLHESDEFTLEALERFQALPDAERAVWRDRVFEVQRKHASEYVEPTDPHEPDPGASRPPNAIEGVA